MPVVSIFNWFAGNTFIVFQLLSMHFGRFSCAQPNLVGHQYNSYFDIVMLTVDNRLINASYSWWGRNPACEKRQDECTEKSQKVCVEMDTYMYYNSCI